MDSIPTASGKEKAWEALACLEPENTAIKAGVHYDMESGLYTLKSFGMDFQVSSEKKDVCSASPQGSLLLDNPDYFFRLSVPWYLACAKHVPATGRLVRPVDIKDGGLFARGTHVLPMNRIAEKYAGDKEGFIRRGCELGGRPMQYGDASIELMPFPRMPVTMILWLEDEEFPARADLFFDSTCDLQFPADILWSTAMLSILLML